MGGGRKRARPRARCRQCPDRRHQYQERIAQDIPEGLRFATIWSNPPIRIGKPALHALLEQWLPRLEPGASAWLVVAKQLGGDSLQDWIADRFAADGLTVRRVATDRGYRVLEVRSASGHSPE